MSHYFSRAQLVVRPRDSELLRNLASHGDAYRDHALVWRLFPGDGLPRDFIFRRDLDALGRPVYFIVSRRPPQTDSGLLQVQSKAYRPQLSVGEWLRFDLRANPTISRKVEGKSSRRHDVLMDAKRRAGSPVQVQQAVDAAGLAWLLERSVNWGLEVAGDSVLQSAYQQHRLHPRGKRIEYSSLDYQGFARVVDPQRLQQALLEGVGHGKGFGCGLLLVKRVS
ncbi:type I-E CRISPR-associated protein Cas6/Cse3/CasE [Pseudomonas jinjuensis]|uniref:CRISPR system Cascade subunit CasE n=1 Tax=Pseudomonas jinjuensis TaxID=198616 RepID=A0A1H0AUI7_9PSED|nr:type I-E CRISPR-associated protein Cas6/Cse3/CasE [Pseudomonas jinjuensis]SDN37071.1 CRISPR system Cascade subunit CasE [Pseudomonas jinjuensis]